MQHFLNIFKIPVIIILATLLSCGKKEGIIPAKELSIIISDMYLADQYLEFHESLRAQTDTLNLYEGIFNKYGYTFADYSNSLKYYLQDGDALYKIHIKAKKILTDKREQVNKLIAIENGKIIDWWAVDSIRKKEINNLWKEPFLRSVKWVSMQNEPANWSFTDTVVYDVPHNAIWWENNIKLNIPGNNDTLYPILMKDYLITLEVYKAREEKKARLDSEKKRKEKEKKKEQENKKEREKVKRETSQRKKLTGSAFTLSKKEKEKAIEKSEQLQNITE